MEDPSSTAPTSSAAQHVARSTRRGISWDFVGAVVTNGVRFLVVAILGRALSAADFGVVAAALSITVVLHNIRDVGLGPALIQRRNLDDSHVATAFAVSAYLGIAIALGLAVAAPALGAMYRIPQSVNILRALGLIFALRGIATTSMMMCQRDMAFRAIAIIDASSYTIGSMSSVGLALYGVGPWSLVIGYLVEETLSTVAYLVVRPPIVSFRVHMRSFKELMGFGGGQTIIQMAGIFATYGDNFVVGRKLGSAQLGSYTRAYDLIKFPSAVFTNVVGNVLFPAFSKFQTDRPRLAAAFRRVIFVNALVLLPASAVLITAAPEAISVIMGPGWAAAVMPFRVLALTMFFRTSYKVGAMAATATGRVYAVALANIIYMFCVVLGAAATIQWGIVGVAASTASSICIVYAICSRLASTASGLRMGALMRAHVPGLVIGVIVLSVTWPLAEVLRAYAAPLLTLLVLSVTGAVLCLTAIVVQLAKPRGDFAWLRDELQRFRRRKRAPEPSPTISIIPTKPNDNEML